MAAVASVLEGGRPGEAAGAGGRGAGALGGNSELAAKGQVPPLGVGRSGGRAAPGTVRSGGAGFSGLRPQGADGARRAPSRAG